MWTKDVSLVEIYRLIPPKFQSIKYSQNYAVFKIFSFWLCNNCDVTIDFYITLMWTKIVAFVIIYILILLKFQSINYSQSYAKLLHDFVCFPCPVFTSWLWRNCWLLHNKHILQKCCPFNYLQSGTIWYDIHSFFACLSQFEVPVKML